MMELSKIYRSTFGTGYRSTFGTGARLSSFVPLSTVLRTPTAVCLPVAAEDNLAPLLPVILAKPIAATYAHHA